MHISITLIHLYFLSSYAGGSDFVPVMETVVFMPCNNNISCVPISIIDDDVFELNETFDISLSPAVGFESLVILSNSSDIHTITISIDSSDRGIILNGPRSHSCIMGNHTMN